MNPNRKKYVIATALLLLPVVGLGLGWGFYLRYNGNNWISPGSIGFIVATILYANIPGVFYVLARSTVTIAMKEIVLLDNGKSQVADYNGRHFACKIKYKKYHDGKFMLSPNKRTWFSFPEPDALNDYPLDELIEIPPDSTTKKR